LRRRGIDTSVQACAESRSSPADPPQMVCLRKRGLEESRGGRPLKHGAATCHQCPSAAKRPSDNAFIF
jgi:hypothetical protein